MPAMIPGITGVQEVLRNLRLRREQMARGVAQGIKRAGLRLQRESQKLVPVDTGNLKASAFTRSEGEGFKTEVSVGFTAAYAIFVHEAVEMKLKGQKRPGNRGKFWDPQGRGQAKFLEEPARRLGPELRKIILDSGRIRI